MNFFIVVLLVCLFIFLFYLYFVSHDDFVLLRRDISAETLFNISFLMVPASLFSARLLYVILHPSANFFNPLYFILFPYFPGLSLLGGVIGTAVFLFFLFRFRRMPVARLIDLFTLSFLAAFPVGVVGYFVLAGANLMSASVWFTTLSYIFLFLFFSFFLFPRFLKDKAEGSIGILFLISYSFVSLIQKVLERRFILEPEIIILALILVSSTAFYVRKEKLISKFNDYFF